MITIKLPITVNDDLKTYINQYNSVLRYSYNRLLEDLPIKEIKDKIKLLNNIELLDVSITDNALLQAQEIVKLNKDVKVIFGGKKNFYNRLKNLITKDQYKELKNTPLTIYGRALDKGNRKFDLNIINDNSILFKPNRNNHYTLQLPKLHKQYKNILELLDSKANNKELPVTIGFNYHHLFITFDEIILNINDYTFIKDRILSIDLNPNYIGLSIIDYDVNNNQTIIHKEVINNKLINDINTKGLPSTNLKSKYKNNKRRYEIFQISKYIINKLKHFQCESLSFEKLSIKTNDKLKGKAFNKLVNNQWLRQDFTSNLKKRCRINRIKVIEVLPQYSSFIGQLTNPNDIDSVAASIELSRRANLFNKIYLTKELPKQDIIFPKFNISSLTNHWKKELMDISNNIKSWLDLYQLFKKSKISYRFLYDDFKEHCKVFRLFNYKSLIYSLIY